MEYKVTNQTYKELSNQLIDLIALKDETQRTFVRASEDLACFSARALAEYLMNDVSIHCPDICKLKVVVPVILENEHTFHTCDVIGITKVVSNNGKYEFECKYRYSDTKTNITVTKFGMFDPHTFAYLPKFGDSNEDVMFGIIKNYLSYF